MDHVHLFLGSYKTPCTALSHDSPEILSLDSPTLVSHAGLLVAPCYWKLILAAILTINMVTPKFTINMVTPKLPLIWSHPSCP